MTNVYKRFQALLPQSPLHYAEVTAHHADGSSSVEAPDGSVYRVRGTSVAVGAHAYIREGRIIEAAPALTFYDETV